MQPPVFDFSGLWIPLVTPFRDGAIDHRALDALVRRLAPSGIAGFVVCGSTGEAAALDEDEQLAALLVPPHYIRPSQDGLRQWFEAIAQASRAPLLVYDIPYRTGATIETATLRERIARIEAALTA